MKGLDAKDAILFPKDGSEFVGACFGSFLFQKSIEQLAAVKLSFLFVHPALQVVVQPFTRLCTPRSFVSLVAIRKPIVVYDEHRNLFAADFCDGIFPSQRRQFGSPFLEYDNCRSLLGVGRKCMRGHRDDIGNTRASQ